MSRALFIRLKNNYKSLNSINIISAYNFTDKQRKPLFTKKSSKIEDATIESESKDEQSKRKTFPSIKDFTQAKDDYIQYRSKMWDWEPIFQRCLELTKHDKGIPVLMSNFSVINILSGIPFFIIFYYSRHYLIMNELCAGYMLVKMTGNIYPFNKITYKMANNLKLRYPSLNECNFSKKLPDPKIQTFQDYQNSLMSKFGHKKMDENDRFNKIFIKVNSKYYDKWRNDGLSFEMADNARFIVLLPIFTAIFYYSGLTPFLLDFNSYNIKLANIFGSYVGSAYIARLLSPYVFSSIALPFAENKFNPKNDK